MFITTYGPVSKMIALSAIISANRKDSGWLVSTIDGKTHQVDDTSMKIALELTPVSSVPALPGTYVVEPCEEEDGTNSVLRTAVLGWSILADGNTRPMTIDYQATEGGRWAVLFADGRVESAQGGHQ